MLLAPALLLKSSASSARGLREAQKLDFPAYRDQNHEARLAFAQWGTPEFFILDAKGRVRFRVTTLERAAAQLVSVDDR